MTDYVSEYYPLFGVKTFHDQGIYGRILSGPLINTRIKVYIIDTGFDDLDGNPNIPGQQQNPDLSNVIVRQHSNSPVTKAPSPFSPSHGSLTSALVAAPINNFGIVGVCPEATVYLGDVDDESGVIPQSNLVSAINDAVELGVDIISISLGSTTFIPALETAINNALNAGIYVFAAAGNSSRTRYEYPAAFPGAISVASVNIDRQLSSFNTRNERVALFAPGENYFLPSNAGPVRVNGTSFSCPYAAGLWALHLAKERATTTTYKPNREATVTILRSEAYLNNGTLAYPAVTNPADIQLDTRTLILVGAGMAAVGLVFFIYLFGREKIANKLAGDRAIRKQEKFLRLQEAMSEMDRECALRGNCA
jgi:hypothetical protein